MYIAVVFTKVLTFVLHAQVPTGLFKILEEDIL